MPGVHESLKIRAQTLSLHTNICTLKNPRCEGWNVLRYRPGSVGRPPPPNVLSLSSFIHGCDRTVLYAHFRTAAPRYAVRHTTLLARPAEQHYYLTAGQQDNRKILGLRVNLIYTWLPGKGAPADDYSCLLGPPPKVGGWESLMILRLHNREWSCEHAQKKNQWNAATNFLLPH